MKGAIRCLFTLEETTDCTDNITVILFSDMFNSSNISKETSSLLNVPRLLFLFTASLAGKNLRVSLDVYLRALNNSKRKQLLFFP
jgi:hypothetical protein